MGKIIFKNLFNYFHSHIGNYAIVIILILIFSSSYSQINNSVNFGQPFIKYFSPNEYNSGVQNWCIVQDNRGVMYFGNNENVLEFDGINWRTIKIPRSQLVRAITKDDNGKIYLTAGTDLGYLEPDSIGKLEFKSLLKLFGNQYQQRDEIWDVVANSEGVFFKTKDKVYRWSNNKITIWDSVFAFRLYKIDDKIYSRNQGTGLMKIEGDSIKLIQGGDYFASIGVFDMLQTNNGDSTQKSKILITTNYDGVFIYDGKNVSHFKTDVDDYFINNQIYNACVLNNGNYAFATQRGGVAIVSDKGKLIKIINQDKGLPTNIVYDVYSDFSGGLWIATENGIARIEINTSFSIITPEHYYNNTLYSIVNFNDRIYASNSLGIMYFDKSKSSFELVEGSNKPGNTFFTYNENLFAGTNLGLAIVDKNRFSKILFDEDSYKLVLSNYYANRIYICHRTGLSILQKNINGNYEILSTPIKEEDLYSLVEDNKNSLWIRSAHGRIVRIEGDLKDLGMNTNLKLNYEYFDENTGFDLSTWEIYDINGKMILTTNNGTFKYSEKLKRFIPDSTLGNSLSNTSTKIQFIRKGVNENFWILAEINDELKLGKAKKNEQNQYVWNPIPEFNRLDLNSVSEIYSDYNSITQNEILWISNDEGLITYNPSIHSETNFEFNTLIRKVNINNDSLIYAGTKNNFINKSTILPFSQNNITFEVSAISYERSTSNQYQFYLVGNDDNWSKWTNETKKVYTNLANGNYNFRVRSKNIYGNIGKEDEFHFRILPPWYLTWWAFLLYTFFIALGIYITDRIMRRKIIKKEREKAKLREAELIKNQAEELETVDRLVRVINKADNLETLFNSLLTQTINFIPQAEKAAVFLLDHNTEKFRIAYTFGYKVDDFNNILFEPEELSRRYTKNSEEIAKGIYILNNADNLFEFEKDSDLRKVKSMMIMAVERDNKIEAYVVFDSFADKNAFESSTARILNKFREHAVSAISKAQSLKLLQEINLEIIQTQEKLITQEKLASLGTLTAGIAHEIKNPLNFVNNFAEISAEIIDELKEKINHQFDLNTNEDKKEILETIGNLKEIIEKINTHGARADGIVKSMLLHSRGNSGEKALSDINDLLEQYLNLAYHGFRANDKSFNITIERDYDKLINKINIIPQNISRVFLNIINNGLYAAYEKKKTTSEEFNPVIRVSTKNLNDKIEIRIRDNGNGIPYEIRKNLFNPFFTTKPTGEGTGLGLSLSYDIIVKEHSGEIRFESELNKYTEFIITLPKK